MYKNVVLAGDVVAAEMAFSDPYASDSLLYASKLTEELRNMSTTMGRSLASLDLCKNEFTEDVKRKNTPGTYAVVAAVVCKAHSVPLISCLQGIAYAELSSMVFAALRMNKLNFIEGQKLIGSLLDRFFVPEEFGPFNPLADILSRKHQVREPKMFLS